MKRIMVIGCCGSGKSTFSKELNNILNIHVIHLDQYFWQSNWVEMDKSNWSKLVTHLAHKPEWIMDGNYGGTMDIRIKRADTIIFLDFPTMQCLWRITKRIIKYHGKVRPDMSEGCKERFDIGFYHYVLTYNLLRRKKILSQLEKLKGEKQIKIFRSDTATAAYLADLKMHGLPKQDAHN